MCPVCWPRWQLQTSRSDDWEIGNVNRVRLETGQSSPMVILLYFCLVWPLSVSSLLEAQESRQCFLQYVAPYKFVANYSYPHHPVSDVPHSSFHGTNWQVKQSEESGWQEDRQWLWSCTVEYIPECHSDSDRLQSHPKSYLNSGTGKEGSKGEEVRWSNWQGNLRWVIVQVYSLELAHLCSSWPNKELVLALLPTLQRPSHRAHQWQSYLSISLQKVSAFLSYFFTLKFNCSQKSKHLMHPITIWRLHRQPQRPHQVLHAHCCWKPRTYRRLCQWSLL